MHRSGLQLTFLVAFWITAISAAVAQQLPADIHCEENQECLAEGRLEFELGYPGSGARVVTPRGCIALLLPPAYFTQGSGWYRSLVRVSGVTRVQPLHDFIHSFEYRDRTSAAGYCFSSKFIYVTEIEKIDDQALASAIPPVRSLRSDIPCESGRECEAVGRLEFEEADSSGFGTRLITPRGCTTVLLPPEILNAHDEWDGVRVYVSGLARPQHNDARVVWFDYAGRMGYPKICSSEEYIFVIELEMVRETYIDNDPVSKIY